MLLYGENIFSKSSNKDSGGMLFCRSWVHYQENSFVPIMTDESPAPDELLNLIRCNCRLTSKNLCGGNNCSYRANGLNCVAACGDCCGTQCMNCKTNAIAENNVEDDEEYEGNIFESIFGV